MSKKQKNESEFVVDTMNSYLDRSDWRIQENANSSYSVGGLIMHSAGAMTARYWLDHIYPEHVRNAHKEASLHIHDLSMLAVYCCGWSLKQLIQEGLGGVSDRITSAPAKHLSTLMQQMVNFLGIMQNEAAGAQALSSFDTYLAPFVKADAMTDKEIHQCLQTFLFGVNTPSRWSSMVPFVNLTIDWVCPNDLKDLDAIIGGESQDFTYGECQPEMDRLNRIFIEEYIKGDANGRGFLYPIPTYNITKDFNWERPNCKLLFEMTSKYGVPYFQNYINSDLNPSDVRSMCCRLSLDKRELRKRGGGLFGADEFTGSIGVVTINLPQIAYLTKQKYASSEEMFMVRLLELMETARDSLEIKRRVITEQLNAGLYPYIKRYLPRGFGNHFSTIGLVGMNEACINMFGEDITTDKGKTFAERVLDYMRETLIKFQEETGNLYNLEATPAESTSYRLAKHDKENYPEIITAGEDAPYYTNSTQLPVGFTTDIFNALDRQESLQIKYTGGTVFHVLLGEAVKDWESCRELVKTICTNYKIPYISISPTYSVCSSHGYLNGSQPTCPTCGKETEVYSRIVGYYRPEKLWNAGKKSESKQRKMFVID